MPVTVGWQDILLRLVLTVIAGAALGLNRTERGMTAGLRTTLLVTLAAAVSMIQANLLLVTDGKMPGSFSVLDLMRLPLGILTGMGFIGAGAILRRGGRVSGVTTAATLWLATVLGICFGGGQHSLGLAGLALALVILWALKKVEARIPQEQRGTLSMLVTENGPTDEEIRAVLGEAGARTKMWSVAYSGEGNATRRKISCEVHWPNRLDDPLGQPRLNNFGSAVDLVAIPHDRPRTTDLALELPQEQNNFLAVEVLVVVQEHKVQTDTQRLRAERDGTDHADTIMPIRAVQNGCLAARGHGTADHGRQQKAGFVEQSDTRTTPKRLTDNAGPIIRQPPFDLLKVTFAGPFLWLLACPVEASHKQPVHVSGVIMNAEVPSDQHRDAFGRPQVVGPSVSHSSLFEQCFQRSQLLRRQSWLGSPSGFGGQPLGVTSRALPATQGATRYTKNSSDDTRGLSRFNQRHCSPSASFQLSGCSFGPHTSF